MIVITLVRVIMIVRMMITKLKTMFGFGKGGFGSCKGRRICATRASESLFRPTPWSIRPKCKLLLSKLHHGPEGAHSSRSSGGSSFGRGLGLGKQEHLLRSESLAATNVLPFDWVMADEDMKFAAFSLVRHRHDLLDTFQFP